MDVNTIIGRLGGVSAAARFFETTPAAISFWKKTKKIPNARLLHLKAARPEVLESGLDRDGLPKPTIRTESANKQIKEFNDTPPAAGIAATHDAG